VRLACANVADTPSPAAATPKSTGVSERRPEVDDTVYVWDINWGDQEYATGVVKESPVSSSRGKRFMVEFDETNSFPIPYKQSNKTAWTFSKEAKVPEACLTLLAKKTAKAERKKQAEEKANARSKAGAGGKGGGNKTTRKDSAKKRRKDESSGKGSSKRKKNASSDKSTPKRRNAKGGKGKSKDSAEDSAKEEQRRKQASPKRCIRICSQCQRWCPVCLPDVLNNTFKISTTPCKKFP